MEGPSAAHARVVTVTPLSGVPVFTPKKPFVHSIRHENPYSDSTTSNYGGITSLLNIPGLHTPSPPSFTYARPETSTTQRLQWWLKDATSWWARRDSPLAETSLPRPTTPETATTQQLQRRLHSNLPRHERARRDRLLAETSLLRPPTFRVDHVMSGPR